MVLFSFIFVCPYSEEEEIIPGQSIPPECHAKHHTNYDGAIVRSGLTHHKEIVADYCQACVVMKCNIWVYSFIVSCTLFVLK